MATIDLGKIKLKWRGTYAGGTAYVPDDVVEYTDGTVTSSYICVTASTGNAPSSGGSAHSSWNYMSKGQASPSTTQGDIIVRGASADGRLAIGAAGKVLKVNSSANGLEYGTGFAGDYYLAYANQFNHSVTVSVNGSQLANGNLDGNRNCIVINNGNYHTVTPAHVDDKLVMSVSSNLASNWTSTGTYWGLGFMSATNTAFSANRNVFYLMGQHSHGNGAAGGDEYRQTTTGALQFDVSDIGLNVGTTYYIRPIGQVHSPNQSVSFNNASGDNTGARHNCYLHHYKKQT